MKSFDPYDALVPVFVNTDNAPRIQQIASAVFVEFLLEPFLFTAAHVTDNLDSAELLVPTSGGLSPIYMLHIDLLPEQSRDADPIDIAYFRLTSEFASELSHHFAPLPGKRIKPIASALELGVCSASGYPATKAKQFGGTFSSEIFSFRGVCGARDAYDKLSLAPEANIVIQYDKKRAVNPHDGKSLPGPDLRGISGGAIFAWPLGAELSDDWTLPNLVGIVHTFKEKKGLLIGTTLAPLLAAITLGRMKRYGGVQ